MRRILIWLVVLALVAFSATPVMADRGSGGNGNGDQAAQQGGGDQTQQQDRDQERNQDGADDPAQQQDRDQEREQQRDQDGDGDQVREQEREQPRLQDGIENPGQEQTRLRTQERVREFELAGRVVAVDREAGTVTVAVRAGETLTYRVQLKLQASALVQQMTGYRWAYADRDALRVGQPVLAHGTTDGGVWTASRIRIGR